MGSAQATKPQQVAGLFKGGVIGKFMNVDTAVGENTPVPIDVADGGICGNDALKTFGGKICSHTGHALARSFGDVLRSLTARKHAADATLRYTPNREKVPSGTRAIDRRFSA
jgi:hypothetical protein